MFSSDERDDTGEKLQMFSVRDEIIRTQEDRMSKEAL